MSIWALCPWIGRRWALFVWCEFGGKDIFQYCGMWVISWQNTVRYFVETNSILQPKKAGLNIPLVVVQESDLCVFNHYSLIKTHSIFVPEQLLKRITISPLTPISGRMSCRLYRSMLVLSSFSFFVLKSDLGNWCSTLSPCTLKISEHKN